ncbi:uncharacterized protein I206_101623 [Kwoniella pini CBS 10737]|uniref:E3 ubiquitin-protein ligase SHPRH n=1 Tax=Kwoniella pini CBS 10737 TaxID=1296096 RepID=A0AAJ8MLC6_9TREE
MSDTTLPSTSSYFVELHELRYDVDQMVKGVDAALARKATNNKTSPASSSTPLFHLHTCTIETTLKVPQSQFEYFGGRVQPNPAYQTYTELRSKLSHAVDPFVPLDIGHGLDVVRPYLGSPGHWGPYSPLKPGVKVYLPGAHKKKHLTQLDTLIKSVSKEWIPAASAWDSQNWLHAILALDPNSESTRKGNYRDGKQRFQLNTNLQICWIPEDSTPGGVDIKLLITVKVMVDPHTILEPLPELGRDMLGLILHSLIPSPTSTDGYINELEARANALNAFYACLRSAPDLPFNFVAGQLQPKEMVSKLLPFQTRTLRLLLQRERGTSISHSDPIGFWKKYDFGTKGSKIAYRRLTGDLKLVGSSSSSSHIVNTDKKGKGRAFEPSPERALDDLDREEETEVPTLLDLSGVRGTMLCEEMGLGKTVEAIALVLLNRHPLSRSRVLPPRALNNETAQAKSSTNPKDKRLPKAPVPVIDLLKGTPGMEIEEVKKWVESEQLAFRDKKAWDEQAQMNVTEVATTLIVTPPPLLKQWVAEMEKHAPSLRVCVYEGWKSLQKGVEKQRAARMRAAEAEKKRKAVEFRDQTRTKYSRSNASRRVKVEAANEIIDVDEPEVKPQMVEEEEGTLQSLPLTISSDLKVALPAPKRSRRSTANYKMNERPRSPLVMVEWWRVIMDEVQLAGDSSDSANMVSLIPRKNSLAVSGTPARADIKDLMGSLKFLRVPIIPHDTRLWHRLQQPSMRAAFEGLFRSIAVRTTKREVSGEFSLPHQNRFVVPIELSEIEMAYYNDTLDRSRDRLHLPADRREARPEDWTLDRGAFIVCLRNLRQICTHIQVGQMGDHLPRGGGGGERRLHLGRSLMTMPEALERMRNDHTQEFLLESRKQMRLMIKKAQLTSHNEEDELRYLTALNLYDKVKTTLSKQLTSVHEHLKNLLGDREDTVDIDGTPDRQQSQQERERILAIQATKASIRDISIVLHQAWFYEGDVRHMRKEQEAEIDAYAQADSIRKEILKGPLQTANTSVEFLKGQLRHTSALHDVEELQTDETDNRGGMLSNSIITQANDLLEIMNDNAFLVFEWRAKILALLSSPIDAENNEPLQQGESTDVVDPEAEYYAEALKAQGEVEAYMAAFAAAIADRKEFLLENRSLLAEHDARQTKQRSTKAALNAVVDDPTLEMPNEVQEQAKLLMSERQAFRDARVEKGCERPLKGLLIDLNGIANGPHRHEEVTIARETAKFLKAYIDEQTKYVEKLNKELDLFQNTFNKRVKYFAALQEISDSVSAPEMKKKPLAAELIDCNKDIDELEVKLARMVVKGRYLQFLGNKDDDNGDIKEDCIICFGSSDDTQAVLLECGHYFCLSCYKEYRKSPMGRRCPSCRTEINTKEITRIKLKSDQPGDPSDEAEVDKINGDESTGPASQIVPEILSEEAENERRAADLRRLKMMDVEKIRGIMNMDMLGEYGSKINFLVKHLLSYKSREPDARHVIFSNWSDSLNIVMQALRSNDIKYTSFDEGKKRKDVVDEFLKDESIKVFLLHAERESSGLTLTSCTVVHLLEPVLRHSFELQAIGRVDRLGQKKETTVFCYATLETVESRILSQGVRNGTSIYLDAENADQQVAELPNVASAASKGGDVAGEGNEEDLLGLIW